MSTSGSTTGVFQEASGVGLAMMVLPEGVNGDGSGDVGGIDEIHVYCWWLLEVLRFVSWIEVMTVDAESRVESSQE